MKQRLFFFFLLLTAPLTAQVNNECAGAIPVADPTDFCSALEAGSTVLATPSSPAASCMPGFADVWYQFTAVAPQVTLIVNGASNTPGGQLIGPGMALYGGNCNNLTELACTNDNFFINVLELHYEGLTPGQTYYFRIGGVFPGTFQFCIRNYFTNVDVSGDCPDAVVLCDQSSFNVGAVTGPGSDPNELNDADCFGAIGGEFNSSWFVFTIQDAGLLEFTLTPNNLADDLDFVLYRLPNGIGNCNGKIVERCMAAGDFDPNSPCMGATGLSVFSTDTEQDPGCLDPGDDNFLAALNAQAGVTYALVVNNFTSSGNGFQVNWGGTATFVGPEIAFTDSSLSDSLCINEAITLSDSSTFVNGQITSWKWTFGPGATPDSALSAGPHTVRFNTPGQKLITLSIETDRGCTVSASKTLTVYECCTLSASVAVTPNCSDPADNSAVLSFVNAIPPVDVLWSTGQSGTAISGLVAGQYSVTATDAAACSDTIMFTVTPPEVYSVTTIPDTTILLGNSLAASASVQPSDSTLTLFWVNGSDTLSGNSVVLQPQQTTTWAVLVLSGDCVYTDSLTVTVLEELFEVPNAFSPNGDGVNETFGPLAFGVKILGLEIWSRWGELIYNDTERWDGTVNGNPAASDVYLYRIKAQFEDGRLEERKGDVTLLR